MLDTFFINFVKTLLFADLLVFSSFSSKENKSFSWKWNFFGLPFAPIFKSEYDFGPPIFSTLPIKPFVSPSGSAITKNSWPESAASTKINRIYKLYRGNINDTEIYFLCLRGSGTFAAPGPVFANTEEGIKDDMKRLYNINV